MLDSDIKVKLGRSFLRILDREQAKKVARERRARVKWMKIRIDGCYRAKKIGDVVLLGVSSDFEDFEDRPGIRTSGHGFALWGVRNGTTLLLFESIWASDG